MTDADGSRRQAPRRVQVLPDPNAPWRPTWPFVLVAASAFPVAALPLGGPTRGNLVVLAAVFFVVAAILTLLPGSRWQRAHAGTVPPRHAWLAHSVAPQLPVVFWCLTVATLQHAGGGGAAGYTALLILPVVAQAVYGTRRDLVAALVLTALTMLLPIFIWGAPHYPSRDYRRALLWLVCSAGAGLVIEDLVRAGRERQQSLVAVARLGRELDASADIGSSLSKGATRITGADVALLFEPSTEGSLELLGFDCARPPSAHPAADVDVALEPGAPADGPPATIGSESDPAGLLDDTAEPLFEAQVDPNRGPLDRWLSEQGVTTVLHVHATRHWRRHAVLTLGWRRIGVSSVQELSPIAELLANEAVVALERAGVVSGLEEAAAHDPLTGLANRRTWDARLATEVSRCRSSHEPLAVVLLDLDRFKAFNDTNGHVAGDELLHDAARAWRAELREGDLLARWGGEEFGLLLCNTEVEEAVEIVERVRTATPGGQTVSAGLAMFNRNSDATSLTDAADRALYAAKQAGRDRLAVSRSTA